MQEIFFSIPINYIIFLTRVQTTPFFLTCYRGHPCYIIFSPAIALDDVAFPSAASKSILCITADDANDANAHKSTSYIAHIQSYIPYYASIRRFNSHGICVPNGRLKLWYWFIDIFPKWYQLLFAWNWHSLFFAVIFNNSFIFHFLFWIAKASHTLRHFVRMTL